MGLLMTNIPSFSADTNIRKNRLAIFIMKNQEGLLILVKILISYLINSGQIPDVWAEQIFPMFMSQYNAVINANKAQTLNVQLL